MKFGGKNIYIIGIGGISLSALAILLVNFGSRVQGSDENNSEIITKLKNMGINVFLSHSAENIKQDVDFVVYSAAISEDNVELKRARELNKPCFTRAEVLGEIAANYENVIAVSGSHGKTTTTGMIANCFILAKKQPTVHVGGVLKDQNTNIIVGGKKYFITEACEYKNSFLALHNNTVACVLNVQADHMDFFKTIDNLQNSFKTFLNQTGKNGINIINIDDEFLQKTKLSHKCITYGIKTPQANIVACNIVENKLSKFEFDIKYFGSTLTRVSLPISGFHEIYNALACFAACFYMGISPFIIKKGIEKFKGVKRRNEEIGRINGALVIHDYAHHPTEIQANIDAAKRFTNGNVYVIFQPHTFSRTKLLWDDFVKSLSSCFMSILYPIYPAREEPISGVTSAKLSESICNFGKFSLHFDTFEKIVEYLKSKVNKNDTILILGAGNIVDICPYFEDDE